MKEDIETKIYKSYFDGQKDSFDLLYNKYKERIKYFVYNIVKDYQEAEDITQETFMYVLQNKMDERYNFKYYIYLIAKSRAINFIKNKPNNEDFNDENLLSTENYLNQDIDEIITRKEERKKLLEAINELDDKYRNALYLVKIEEFSYKEVSEILGESVQNVKNLVHRGKQKLKPILIQKGFKDKNRYIKMLTIILCTSILLSGIVYATIKIIKYNKTTITPLYTSNIENIDTNTVWIGSFQIAWNEFINERIHGNVEFVDGESKLVEELNKQSFNSNMISEKDYYIQVGKTSNSLKEKILKDIKDKFGFKVDNSYALNRINFDKEDKESFTIYSIINKKFDFLRPFDKIKPRSFYQSEEKVNYFGIINSTPEEINDNVEVLFFDGGYVEEDDYDKKYYDMDYDNDYAVKIKTKNENEEVILYVNNSSDSFESIYNKIEEKSKKFTGNKNFKENDEIIIPYINIDTIVSYDELCNREIKGTKGLYIENALQNVKFALNEKGVNLSSESIIQDTILKAPIEPPRYFMFDRPFVLFLKEKDKEKPYFALRINNTELLVKSEN